MNFQIISVVILLVFYACYFGKMISQKKKGIHTDQMGKGKTGRAKFIEITLKIATLCVPIVEVISIALNTSCLFALFRYAGVIFALLGDLFFICSVLTMRDSWRAGVSKTDKTELVTTGIYQISRNPAFLGFDLVYVGILLMFFNWILLAVSVFTAIMLHLQIVYVEEDFLMTVFGKEYINYSKKVKRYIGRKKGANS
ncbi:MAG: isoprenylcysteine carboxylmethyltransferase family protein [Lachnospiraceae bacterium]|nr:isoprenylcysteine carboxylmethyltransferase family protein [Lachnospiraceae bacterium]